MYLLVKNSKVFVLVNVKKKIIPNFDITEDGNLVKYKCTRNNIGKMMGINNDDRKQNKVFLTRSSLNFY